MMKAPPMTNRQRFERLYSHYHPYVRAYAARRVAQSTVDDVVADCFLVAWRRLEDVPDDGLPWLYRTAAHIIGTNYRTAQRWTRLHDRLAAEPTDHPVDPVHHLVVRDEIAAALRCLAADDRELIMLADWEGLGTPDIAVTLAVKPGTVRVRLHRARGRLRALLEQQPVEELQ